MVAAAIGIILAAIAVPNYERYTREASVAEATMMLQLAHKEQQRLHMTYGLYGEVFDSDKPATERPRLDPVMASKKYDLIVGGRSYKLNSYGAPQNPDLHSSREKYTLSQVLNVPSPATTSGINSRVFGVTSGGQNFTMAVQGFVKPGDPYMLLLTTSKSGELYRICDGLNRNPDPTSIDSLALSSGENGPDLRAAVDCSSVGTTPASETARSDSR